MRLDYTAIGSAGPAMASYENDAGDPIAYDNVDSGEHRDATSAWADFDEVFAKWLAGRSPNGVVWRMTPELVRSARGAHCRVISRAAYDDSKRVAA